MKIVTLSFTQVIAALKLDINARKGIPDVIPRLDQTVVSRHTPKREQPKNNQKYNERNHRCLPLVRELGRPPTSSQSSSDFYPPNANHSDANYSIEPRIHALEIPRGLG